MYGGVEGLAETLKVNLKKGLLEFDFNERDQHFGSNYRAPQKRNPFCKLFIGALDDFMLKILMVCAVVDIGVDMGFSTNDNRSIAWIEGAVILLAVMVVASVGSWNDYQKEGEFMTLNLAN